VRGDGLSGLGKAQACGNTFSRRAAASQGAARADEELHTQHASTKNQRQGGVSILRALCWLPARLSYRFFF